MAVNVMLIGGKRDGEIIAVPGILEPEHKSYKIVSRKELPFQIKMTEKDTYSLELITLILNIIPRKAERGPTWKIELPKELW